MSNDQPNGKSWAPPYYPAAPPEYPAAPPGYPTPPPGYPTGPPGYPSAPPGAWGPGNWSPPPPPPPGWVPTQAQPAPRPGLVPLRPLAVGELLDGAFTTIRRYPRATLGLSAAVMVVVETIQVTTSYVFLHGVSETSTFSNSNSFSSTNSEFMSRSLIVDVVGLVVGLVASGLLSGLLAAIIGEGALGRPMSAQQAWQAARRNFWRLIGSTAAIWGIIVAIFAVSLAPGIIVAAVGATGAGIALLVIGGLAAMIAGVYFWIALAFAPSAIMLERQGIRGGLGRSRHLIRGGWWRVFGIDLLAGVIAGVAISIISTPFLLLGGGFNGIFSGHPQSHFTFSYLLLSGIAGLLGGTLVRPFTAGVTTLLYLDRRMRAEALDLTLQRAAAAEPPR